MIQETTIRLDKYLANNGVCARRAVEALLKEKIVSVNGKRVDEPGIRVDPEKDSVIINGIQVKKPNLVYFLLNKPKGYISTTSDERSRKNVVSLIKTTERIYPVGRLDKDTTGLLILTNDGEFTNKLTHPRFHIKKTYRLTIQGLVNNNQFECLKNGVKLKDGITHPAEITNTILSSNQTIFDLTIHEGRNRQIRRMCQALNLKLIELERISIGSFSDPKLLRGTYRSLTSLEIKTITANQ
jgi:23S rRNA pseudouridine2605 synthase